MFVKIDPYIIYKSRDKKGNVIPGIDNSKIVDDLIKLGYEHTGFNLNFENLKPMLDNIENEHSIIAEFTPKSEDNYIVNCKIMENNETVFEIKTFAGSRDEAKKIVDNWKNNAEVIYPKLLETLTQSNLHVNGDGSN